MAKRPAKPTVAAPPATLEDANGRIRAALRGGRAQVSVDSEDRVLVRFSSSDREAIEAALLAIGVRKQNTGLRDVYSLGRFEVALAAYQPVVLA